MNKSIRVAAWQFCGSADIIANQDAILRGIGRAREEKADLLLTQECALSGYAAVDRQTTEDINRRELEESTRTVQAACAEAGINLVLGTTAFKADKTYNALYLINAEGRLAGIYTKRALYGDDPLHYSDDEVHSGCHEINGINMGMRICFEFRFPEFFRELLSHDTRLACVAFSMVGEDNAKLPVARAHLMSRAAENGIWIVTANNTNMVQNAPTCIIDPDGNIVLEAPGDDETLVSHTMEIADGPPLRQHIRAEAERICQQKLP